VSCLSNKTSQGAEVKWLSHCGEDSGIQSPSKPCFTASSPGILNGEWDFENPLKMLVGSSCSMSLVPSLGLVHEAF
jgi:hypothetical protein